MMKHILAVQRCKLKGYKPFELKDNSVYDMRTFLPYLGRVDGRLFHALYFYLTSCSEEEFKFRFFWRPMYMTDTSILYLYLKKEKLVEVSPTGLWRDSIEYMKSKEAQRETPMIHFFSACKPNWREIGININDFYFSAWRDKVIFQRDGVSMVLTLDGEVQCHVGLKALLKPELHLPSFRELISKKGLNGYKGPFLLDSDQDSFMSSYDSDDEERETLLLKEFMNLWLNRYKGDLPCNVSARWTSLKFTWEMGNVFEVRSIYQEIEKVLKLVFDKHRKEIFLWKTQIEVGSDGSLF